MDQPLDIRDVVKRTGLTSRALRFYEARGLVSPLRTYSGRRLYGPGELERINQIVALKRAGLSLSQIAALTRDRNLDLGALVDAQVAALETKRAELDETVVLLKSIKSRIDRGEPVDAATLCSLISNKELMMTKDQWDKISDRYLHPTKRPISRARRRLCRRVSTRPTTAANGRTSARESKPQSRLAPTVRKPKRSTMSGRNCSRRSRRATPGMMAGVSRLYEDMRDCQAEPGAPSPGFDADTFRFIQEVGRTRSAG